ncbi:MAG TPA: SCP2 sterol-binding domain-containing protein [Planctomycetota bacterium]|nr:SCP2 sterol-binding domain-containing protein [Planctomycetota bacterium]
MSKGLPEDLTVERYMEHYLPRALNRHAEKLDGIDCVLQLDITGVGGGSWAVTVKERAAAVARGPAVEPRCTFQASAADWLDLVRGKLNGPLAFMTGRFKVSGDAFFAMRLGGQIVAALAGR